MQQFYYNDFETMSKRVERYLQNSRHLRMVRKGPGMLPDTMVYTLKLRWSLLNFFFPRQAIKLSLHKVDRTVTRLELQMKKKEPSKFSFLTKSAWKRLDNLVFIF